MESTGPAKTIIEIRRPGDMSRIRMVMTYHPDTEEFDPEYLTREPAED